MPLRTVTTTLGASALALALLACQPQSQGEELADIRETLDKILAKVEQIEKDQKRIVAAAQPRPQRPTEDYNKVYKLDLATAPIKGDPKAPVTLVEYSDFQCPFCARANPLIEALAEKYPDQLKVAFMHYPLSFHRAARPTAIASMAAQDQGKFWEFHDVLFKQQATLDASKIEDYAREAGLDLDRFRKDMAEKGSEYEKRVQADMRSGEQADVRGTPTLYINGKKVRNRSVDGMSQMIEAALKEG